jgi:radical SAM enzyme (rSAM/lipoprotein system)
MSASDIPFRKKLALNLHRRFRSNEKKLHRLNYIFWECTLRCNVNCLHCGSDCKKETSVKDMPLKDFLRALDDITPIVSPNHTMLALTGGEPTLRRDLAEAGLEFYKRGFPWGIVSNGMNLDEKMIAKLLDSGLRSVTISLDGLEASHNWMRGNPESYRRALNAIGIVKDIPDLRFDVITCVNQRNYPELEEVYYLLAGMGVKEWRLGTITPIGRAAQNELLQLPPTEFRGMFDFMARVRKEGRIKLNYGCEGFLGNYEGEVRDNFFFCRAGISVASVLADGSISACPILRENFIQGNIYTDSFREVWENRYQAYRDRNWTKTGICKDCNFFGYCEGNGLHLRDQQTGELLFCHLKRIEKAE